MDKLGSYRSSATQIALTRSVSVLFVADWAANLHTGALLHADYDGSIRLLEWATLGPQFKNFKLKCSIHIAVLYYREMFLTLIAMT